MQTEKGYFQITSVHKDDIAEAGYRTSSITDEQMEELAQNMADAYMESSLFWDSLEDTCQAMGFAKK